MRTHLVQQHTFLYIACLYIMVPVTMFGLINSRLAHVLNGIATCDAGSDKVSSLVHEFKQYIQNCTHWDFAIEYHLQPILVLCLDAIVVFWLDSMMQGYFITLVPDLWNFINYGQMEKTMPGRSVTSLLDPYTPNPMGEIFPMNVACQYGVYGASGTLQKKSAVCQMRHHATMQTMVLALWFFLLIKLLISLGRSAQSMVMCLGPKSYGAREIMQLAPGISEEFARAARRIPYPSFRLFVLMLKNQKARPDIKTGQKNEENMV